MRIAMVQYVRYAQLLELRNIPTQAINTTYPWVAASTEIVYGGHPK